MTGVEGKLEDIHGTVPSKENTPQPIGHSKSVKTKLPEVEVHLFRCGKGPIDIFKSNLGGWDQDQLEVFDILEKYGLKCLYAFSTKSGRGAPIRINRKNGRSLLSYKDGSTILIDGDPKDSLLKPVTKILVGTVILVVLIMLLLKEPPELLKKMNFLERISFPPWILACMVIVFIRMRKRTRDFLRRYGW